MQGYRFVGFTKPNNNPTLRSAEIPAPVIGANLLAGAYNTNDIAETEEYIIELIPHWEKETHTLVFSYPNSNNATLSQEYSGNITNALSGQEEKAEANAPTGHTFGYWYWMNNGTEIRFSEVTMPDLTLLAANETDPAKIIAAQENGSRTLYAKFTPRTYRISFNSNGGDSFEPVSVIYGSVIPSLPALSRAGCTSGQWLYGDSNITEGANYLCASDILLTARWNYITYTISYNLNEGEITIGNPVNYNVDSNTIVLNEPKKLGFKFTGWEVNGVKKSDIPRGSTGNLTFNATWHGVVVDYSGEKEVVIGDDYSIMYLNKLYDKETIFKFAPGVNHFTLIGDGHKATQKSFQIEESSDFEFNIKNVNISACSSNSVISTYRNLTINVKGENILSGNINSHSGEIGDCTIYCDRNLTITGDKLTIYGPDGSLSDLDKQYYSGDGIMTRNLLCDTDRILKGFAAVFYLGRNGR